MDEYLNDIETVAKSVAKSNGIASYELGRIETNSKGEGYLSKIFTVSIKDKLSETKLNILFKCGFKDETVRKTVPVPILFGKEIYFYTVVYPAFEEFRKTTKCPREYELIAKCYETSMEAQREFLVFDDLKAQGFSILDKSLDLTSDHVELLFRNYGYFHALSLGFKEKNPEKFAEISDRLKPSQALFNLIAETSKRTVQEVSKVLMPGKDDVLIDSFKKYLENPIELFSKIAFAGAEFTVLRHGDCRTSNQLFKYDENTGKPIDVRMVDFQMITVGNLICDLSYALYSDASKTILDCLDDFLRIYYDTLVSTLTKLGTDPETLFSFDELKSQWKMNSKYGLAVGGMIIREKCNKDVKDFNSESDSIETIMYSGNNYDVERYNKKIRDLITHLYEIGAL